MRTLRALVVGYGSIARRHIDNLRASGEVRELLVFRPQGRPADAPQDLRFLPDLADAVAAKPDLAVVASPSSSHIDALLPLLEKGIPCYVEKPPVTTESDVDKLRALLGSRKTPVTLTGCNLRFLPSLQRMREALHARVIGSPVRASLQAGQWLPDWRPARDYRLSYSARREGGGAIFDLIHEIDAARWLFGEFDEVRALSGKFSRLEIDAEDAACILLGRGEGPIVSIGLDYVSRQPVRRYEIVGDEASLIWDLGARRLELVTSHDSKVLDAESASFDVAATYSSAMREFVASIRSGIVRSQDLLDGLKSTALALRARRQIKE